MNEIDKIDESKTTGFSPHAIELLRESVKNYAIEVITEANRIEAGRNPTDGAPEITKSMVNDAVLLIRRGLAAPKKRFGSKFLRVFSAVLSMVVGILYDPQRLVDSSYMIIFIIVLAAAILSVTVSVFSE